MSSGAARAMATARSASASTPSPLISLVETAACLLADQDAQADVVALGALQFLDRAVAHLDRQRHRAHGNGVGLARAGAARGGDEAVGKIGEGGLIEER